MRIELPPASWADITLRPEDDAHTLTVAAQGGPDWVQWQWPSEPGTSVRAQAATREPQTVTITF